MWGAGQHGALGDGSTANSDVPVQVPGTWSQIYNGGSTGGNPHAVGITTSGVVEAWGANEGGELGNNSITDSHVPTPVIMPSGTTFSSVMAGGFESGAIDSNGNVWMWGRDYQNALGDGSKTDLNEAVGSSRKMLVPIKVQSSKVRLLSGTASNIVEEQ
jgi:alpha-tubulin suppressor-like RCC1 family protein